MYMDAYNHVTIIPPYMVVLSILVLALSILHLTVLLTFGGRCQTRIV